MPRRMNSKQYKNAVKHGYRSGFEQIVCDNLTDLGIAYEYESETLEYIQPSKARKYTPDIVLTKKDGSKMYIELKGRWVTADRMKHVYVRQCYPDIDIRFVFTNPKARLSKTSCTTYAQYCERKGWMYSPTAKVIPAEWLEELK